MLTSPIFNKKITLLKKAINLLSFLVILSIWSCQESTNSKTVDTIIIREKTDVASLNPIAATDQLGAYISMHMFQSLVMIDFKSEKPIGIIAKELPEPSIDSSGRMTLHYSIRQEAKFDNGLPIEAKDILFSFKANILPLVENSNGKVYYNFIEDIIPSKEDPKQFDIICKNAAVLNTLRSGDFYILPMNVYDSSNLLSNFSVYRTLNEDSLEFNDSIIQFANQFNKKLRTTSPDNLRGSGPYQLKSWQKGKRIVIEKKENWWGQTLANTSPFFIANTKNLQFEIITDNQTAINALKAGEVDFMNYVAQNDFEKITNHSNITTKQNTRHGYNYLGFNTNNKILQSKGVRKAIENSIPYQKIIDVVFKGAASINRLPLALQHKELRNDTIQFPNQDIEIAKKILLQEGWKDSNKDGTLDKEIDGELVELKLNYHYNSGNEQRKAVGYLLKNELQKVGGSLTIKELEWTSYLKALRAGEVQLFMSGVLTLPITPDFTNLLHSQSANGGRNYSNYQNPELDLLIDSILVEVDKESRIVLIKQLQEIVAAEVPYVFLISSNQRIAYNRRLKNVPIYSLRPNYWAAELK